MSEENEAVAASCCASCGIAENDDAKLKNCTACYLVKYCGIECQKAHRKQHKRACNKRAAELRDELLFKQPESTHLGDCPICCVPMSLDPTKSAMNSCCSKIICIGCVHANKIREDEARLVVFVKAAELGDAEAHYKLSVMYREGDAVDKDEGKSIHHLEEAVIAGHSGMSSLEQEQ